MYYFSKGWNYRAYIAYVVGIAPNFYGFLGVFGVNVTTAASQMYYFAYPMGLALSFGTYWALNKLDPPKAFAIGGVWREPADYIGEPELEDGTVVDGIEPSVDLPSTTPQTLKTRKLLCDDAFV
jgi:nucleobase:cation symporter-1, NCS1 family